MQERKMGACMRGLRLLTCCTSRLAVGVWEWEVAGVECRRAQRGRKCRRGE